jgi:argininosuccinate synthase
MMKDKHVVLAYSGGVDTTACIPYLKHEMGCERVVAMTADLGQGEDLEAIRLKALQAGADDAVVVDVQDDFISRFGFPAIAANALYDRQYPLSSALGRPLIAELLVAEARGRGFCYVAHGCTAKGNDQVRLDLAVQLLAPELTMLAPAREWKFSRAATVAYAESFGIKSHVTQAKPWAVDVNVLGRNVEAGLIEDLAWEATAEVWSMTRAPEQAPDQPEYVTIGFETGRPVSLEGQRKSPRELFGNLNELGGRHGVGRVDMIENRVVGLKSRELYEAPAQTLLLTAHRDLETLTLPSDVTQFKRGLEEKWAELVYNGLWHSPLKSSLDAFINKTQERVTGDVKLRLYKGSARVVQRASSNALYRLDLVTYGSACSFKHESAVGFIDLFGLPSRIWGQVGASSN